MTLSLTTERVVDLSSAMARLAGQRRPADRSAVAPIDVSVVVTVYDEQASLVQLYEEVLSALAQRRWEMLIVDDGSTDGSFEIACRLHERDPRVSVVQLRRNFGKTAALAAGFALAVGEVIITMDGDLQDSPREIPRLLEALESECDLVVGWRKNRMDSLSKRISSGIFNRSVALMTGVHLHDMNCGLKAFKADLASEMKLYGELHRYLPVLAQQKGYRVAEIAVEHRPRRHGHSKYGWTRALGALLDIQMVVFLTRYINKPLRFFGTGGLILLGTGVAMGLYLSALKLLGYSIGTRPLLFLSILLVLSGLQAISTGLIGEMLRNVSFDRRDEYSVRNLLHRDLENGVDLD